MNFMKGGARLNMLIESYVDKIEDVVDYIKGFGEKGKLPAVDNRLSDYYRDALQTAYEWACESTDGVRHDGFEYFKHRFGAYVANSFTFNKRGLIYVERSIKLDYTQDFHDLGYKSVGECWSWKKHNSRSYCADFSFLNDNVIEVILCGYVHPESVDWVETIYLNSYGMKNETEIRMTDNAQVEISYIKIGGKVYRLKGSYLMNANADKYNKEKW